MGISWEKKIFKKVHFYDDKRSNLLSEQKGDGTSFYQNDSSLYNIYIVKEHV